MAVFRGRAEENDTPSVTFGASSPYILRTETFLRNVPVFRSAYFTKRPCHGLFSKTLDLQPLRGLRRGRAEETACFCLPCVRGGGRRMPDGGVAPSGHAMGGGAYAPPCTPLSRPHRLDGQTASQLDIFIPKNAAFAQLSLAHSAAFCYSFLNNRTCCGKRRLLP